MLAWRASGNAGSLLLGLAIGLVACNGLGASMAALRPGDAPDRASVGDEGALVVLTSPDGHEQGQWVERWRGLFLGTEDALVLVPWNGRKRSNWRVVGRRLLLDGMLVALLWQGLGPREILGRLSALPRGSLPWLLMDAAGFDCEVARALSVRPEIELAIVCPTDRPCGLSGLASLAGTLRSLSIKDAFLDSSDLRELGKLRRLWFLSLRGAGLPPGWERHLGGLSSLRVLDLAGARSSGATSTMSTSNTTDATSMTDPTDATGVASAKSAMGAVSAKSAMGAASAKSAMGAVSAKSAMGAASAKSAQVVSGDSSWDRSLAALLCRLGSLRWLDLSFIPIRPSSVLGGALSSLADLRTLRLSSTCLRDEDLEGLTGLGSLRELDLSLTALGDPGMAHLGEMSGLRALDLRDTAVTDLGIPDVARLQELRLLLLGQGPTELGLRWLDGLKTLEGLGVDSRASSARGHSRLTGLRGLWWAGEGRAVQSTDPRSSLDGAHSTCAGH